VLRADCLFACFVAQSHATPVLPAAPSVHPDVEAFDISAADDRVALHGQRGVRAREPISAGKVIGVLRCATLTHGEWRDLQLGVGAGLSRQTAPTRS
jgi:hypothetical protein